MKTRAIATRTAATPQPGPMPRIPGMCPSFGVSERAREFSRTTIARLYWQPANVPAECGRGGGRAGGERPARARRHRGGLGGRRHRRRRAPPGWRGARGRRGLGAAGAQRRPQRPQRGAPHRGLCLHPAAAGHGAPDLHGQRVRRLDAVPDLLRRLPLPGGVAPVHRSRRGPAALPDAAPDPHRARRGHPAARTDDDLPRAVRAVRAPRGDRAVDAAALALRLDNRRDHLLDAVSSLRPMRTRSAPRMADREWVLLNPGPANTSTSVRHALVMPDLGHREREVLDLLRRCRDRLVRLAAPASPPADTAATSGDPVRSSDWSAVLFTGSGTAAVEAAVSSVVPRERSLLVVNNGVYGDRMLRIARAHALHTVVLNYDHLTPVAPEDVEHVLHDYPDVSHVALVHHETTTGLLNPVADVVGVAARQGRRVLVDAMSSLFGEPLDLTQDGLDFVIAGASAGLQAVAGVSFVLGRRPALEALVGRPPRSVYLDLVSQWTQQEADDTLFTPAVAGLPAVEQALAGVGGEGVAHRPPP